MNGKNSALTISSIPDKIVETTAFIDTFNTRETKRKVIPYLLALGLSFSIVLFAFFSSHFLGNTNLFLLLLVPVLVSSWYGNLRSALVSFAVVFLGLLYILFYPSMNIFILPLLAVIELLVFAGIATLIIALINNLKQEEFVDEYRKREKNYVELLLHNKNVYQKAKSEIRARDEFLSIASHELKTPLTSMLLQLQTALSSIRTVSLANFSVESLMKMLVSAEKQTQRLHRMINDLLNISLITTGRLDLSMEKVDLKEVIIDIVERFSERLKQEHVTLTMDVEESIVGTWDKIRVEQVISNLISNAIKYGKGSPIHLRIYKDGAFAKIEIQDQGIGIPKDMQQKIFELFQRGVSAQEYKGLGVGLYISNTIVKAHGGKITIKSKEKKGSTFIVELPL